MSIESQLADVARIASSHPLAIVVGLPLAAVLALLAIGGLASFGLRADGLSATTWKVVGLAVAAVDFALASALWLGFDAEHAGFQFVEWAPWLPVLGIHHFMGLDGLSVSLVLLTTFLVPLVLLASWNEIDHSRRSWVFFVLALETGMLGAFVSLNFFEFYVFFEAMMIPMYFIIGIWGGARRVQAALKFFLFTLLGSVLMLVAALVVYQLGFEQSGVLNLDLVRSPATGLALLEVDVPLSGDAPWWQTQHWLFLAFAVAFGIKVPLVPLHTWLPDAHVEAPTGGSAILAGVLLKIGAFGFLRFAVPLFPAAAIALAPWLVAIALLGVVYGSLLALAQDDAKKLVAYSSIAHLGFVVLGIFSIDVQGVVGSIVMMVSHGLATCSLFLLVGFVYERRGTREIAALGGLAKPMPVFATFFVISAMTSIGLPLTSGFVAEFLILVGSFGVRPWSAVLALLGVVLGAIYMLGMTRRILSGPIENPENRGLIDLGWRERSVLAALVTAILWIGIYPEPLLRRVEPTVVDWLAVVDARSGEQTDAALARSHRGAQVPR